MPGVSDLHKVIAEIVHKWEKESGNVCEKCGAAGELRKDLSWVLTLLRLLLCVIKQKVTRKKKKLLTLKEKILLTVDCKIILPRTSRDYPVYLDKSVLYLGPDK